MILKKDSLTLKLAICGLMAAMAAILGSFFNIPVMLGGNETLRISLLAIPIIFASIVVGPVYGGLTALVADILKFLLMAKGGFMLPLTLSAGLMGLIPGLFFLNKATISYWRLVLATLVSQLIGSVILNTLILHFTFGTPLIVLLPSRLLPQPFYILLYPLIVLAMIKALQRAGLLQNTNRIKS